MSRLLLLLIITIVASCEGPVTTSSVHSKAIEKHRPLIHFSPEKSWMNDPNGLVFFNNTYHLFYQYYPDSTVWGPMHWGHATSTNLVNWNHESVALYPDSLGYIFSGSAVVDSNNTSGFASGGQIPLIAIFTHHDPDGEKAGRSDYQYQSLAFSLDQGKTWTKYANNPVLKNPGIKDFRDPKVFWHYESKKWIMSLAVLDRIHFYSSPNLKDWQKESEFGSDVGAHGGVWECPDLFELTSDGKKVWILFVSINPGGPNGGSATQYFTGSFDGKRFVPFQTDTRWIDYGPDNYAGVTFSNTGDRKIFIGWMSNWWYGQKVPTEKWRSAMTIARDLSVKKIGEKYFVASKPVDEINSIIAEDNDFDLSAKKGKLEGAARFEMNVDELSSFEIVLSNDSSERLVIGFKADSNHYYIDRRQSGETDFEPRFSAIHTAPRISNSKKSNLILIIDNASVELFADDGVTVMTEVFFPLKPYSHLQLNSSDELKVNAANLRKLKAAH